MNLVRGLRARLGLVALATIAAVAFGVISLQTLASGIYPEVDFPRLVAVAHVGDLPPEVIQTEVARPMEAALATVPGVRRLRTRIIRGAVELNAQFESGTDMQLALQLAQADLAADVKLPADAELRVERVLPIALPIVTFNLSGGDLKVLHELATYVVAPAITRVPGVGRVEVQGGDVREVEVILKPEALAAAHLTPSAVADRLAAHDLLAAVGRAHDAHQVLTVMVSSTPTTAEAIAALPVAQGPNGPIPLSAIADVVEGTEDRALSVAGPEGDVVVIAVSRMPGASAPQVVDGVRALVAGVALPAGVRIDTVYDQSILIHDAMHGVRDAILIGVGLSLLVLALFLRDLRAGIAAAVAVPITLIATFGVMRLLGQTLNLMSLGGLAVAIGLVVDDAIVIVEAIVKRLEEGRTPERAAEEGTADLFAAVVGTTLTTVVVFAPLGLISGVVGSFSAALAITLSAAVLLSLLVSLSTVPLLAARLLKPRATASDQGWRVARAYGRLVRRVVRHPALSVLAVLLVAGVGVLASRFMASGFLPTMDEGAFVLDFFMPPGTSLEETDHYARRIDRVLAGTKEVTIFTRRTGTEMGPATATQQNRGDIMVRLVPRKQRDDVDAIIDKVRGKVAEAVPEARVEFVQVLQDILDDLSGNPRPIEVRIFGDDIHVLADLARQAEDKLQGMTQLLDLYGGVENEVPTLEAQVMPTAAALLGIDAKVLASDLEVALAGRVVARVRAGDRTIGVRVRMPDEVRFDPARIADLPLAYGNGVVPLATVAKVAQPVGPSLLLRENQRPVVIMTAAVRGSDLGGAADEVARRLQGLALPAGYQLEVGGQAEGARQSRRDIAGVFAFGIFLILGILLVQLGSLRLSLVVLLGAPLALVGAVVTLAVTGIPLNASSMMGCVLLAGLVVKNGILLLEYAQKQAAEGVEFGEALARAAERRLRPILMTTAATIVGLVPLAFAWGAGSELQRPLAVATIGGLVLSTLVTLLAVPALAYALRSRKGKVESN